MPQTARRHPNWRRRSRSSRHFSKCSISAYSSLYAAPIAMRFSRLAMSHRDGAGAGLVLLGALMPRSASIFPALCR